MTAPVDTTRRAPEELVEARTAGDESYAIEVERLTITYGSTPAVRDLSMHVPRGSIYGLIGPSGAGKTTAIRALSTLQQPDAGTVLIEGIDARSDPAAVRRLVGYLPDFAGVYEDLTVSEYLDFYGGIYRIPARRRRQLIDELLELAGLKDRHNDPVRQLSRGMRQQLGLARCLIHDPRILLLDEPAAGMDPRSRLDLRDILLELSRLGKTVLISSSMLAELAEVCTHLGFLRAGALVAEGPEDEIVALLSPEPCLRVRLLDPAARDVARQVLERYPECGQQLEAEDACTLLVRFAGSDADLAEVLARLGEAGLKVAEFALERRSLEDVFLQVTDVRARA